MSRGRLRALSWAIFFGFALVLARLAYLHVFASARLAQMAKENRQQFRVLHARRGNIVDAHGQLLASTRPVVDVGVDTCVFAPKAINEALGLLAKILGKEPQGLVALYEEGKQRQAQWVKLAEGLSPDRYTQISNLKWKGIYGNIRYERVYPGNALAAHLLGFVNYEGDPSMGVEQALDFYLRGHSGWVESEKDGKRREIAHRRHREVPATDGFHVKLSLDAHIQALCEEEIQRLVKEYNPLAVAIIATEPSSGRVLALANYPTFDLNHYSKAPLDAQRNRAITDIYEPGSCFKIVPMTAALEKKCLSFSEIFDCSQATVTQGERVIKLPKDHKPMGKLSGEEIFIKSSNRGMAHLGLRLGPKPLYDMAVAYGFGERCGLGLIGESPGVLHPPKRWDGLTITRLPMGHAVGATALQVHMAMSVLANGGLLMRPQVATAVLDAALQPVLTFEPRVRRRVCSVQTAQTLKKLLLRATSKEGTSFRAEIPGYGVAVKSGTTQKLIGRHYSRNHHVASCSGFFPAWAPRVAITVVVDQPVLAGTGYGGVVTAPAFKRIALGLIPYLSVEKIKN